MKTEQQYLNQAIQSARRSIESTAPEVNIESTYDSLCNMVELTNLSMEQKDAWRNDLRSQLEEGLKVRQKEPAH